MPGGPCVMSVPSKTLWTKLLSSSSPCESKSWPATTRKTARIHCELLQVFDFTWKSVFAVHRQSSQELPAIVFAMRPKQRTLRPQRFFPLGTKASGHLAAVTFAICLSE
mmetsp:Transcript_42557/g.102540  ORF Transcript_42557/g.102540 Transcript_42557/m.102540 type:complete len:109 (+) Transcript_42557:1547-1873(+)